MKTNQIKIENKECPHWNNPEFPLTVYIYSWFIYSCFVNHNVSCLFAFPIRLQIFITAGLGFIVVVKWNRSLRSASSSCLSITVCFSLSHFIGNAWRFNKRLACLLVSLFVCLGSCFQIPKHHLRLLVRFNRVLVWRHWCSCLCRKKGSKWRHREFRRPKFSCNDNDFCHGDYWVLSLYSGDNGFAE